MFLKKKQKTKTFSPNSFGKKITTTPEVFTILSKKARDGSLLAEFGVYAEWVY